MITSVVTVLFYLTPVVWLPAQVHEGIRAVLVDFNPLAQLLELLRAPLLGFQPTPHNIVISVASTVLVSALAMGMEKKYRSRVAYWL
jgi:ABC-type polysaccharide/polyol phosphate export permease